MCLIGHIPVKAYTLPLPNSDALTKVDGTLATITGSRCVLAVRDLALSTRYYVEVLGFCREPVDAEGWSFLARDTFRVMLGECRDAMPASELGDHSYIAYWHVDDVDEFYREVIKRGALVNSAPANKPWACANSGFARRTGIASRADRRSVDANEASQLAYTGSARARSSVG